MKNEKLRSGPKLACVTSGMARRLEFPATDRFSPSSQNWRGQFLEPHDGAEFFLDGQSGQFVPAALLAGEDLLQIALFHRSNVSLS